MRSSHLAIVAAFAIAACGGNHIGDDAGGDDAGGNGDGGPCQGLACFQHSCPGGGTTSISGTVYAPNGWLPLYNVDVYVPNAAVPDYDETHLSCDQCSDSLPGNPVAHTKTDENGVFHLNNMPDTTDVPVVIQIGRWRRGFVVSTSAMSCADTPIAMDETRFPRTANEFPAIGNAPASHMPKIALTTGGADALECLLRKIGIADSEFGVAGEAGKRVHLYAGNQTSSGGGTPRYDSTVDNGAGFGSAQDFWDTESNLENYDIVMLSCEGAQNTGDKSQTAINNMNQYANNGGRVFGSHWHNYWFQQAATLPTTTVPWPSILTWDNGGAAIGNMTATVNQNFDKGTALAQWLVNVGASGTLGSIDLQNSKHTLDAVDETQADKWVYSDTPPDGSGSSVQYTSFTTPLENPPNQRCGRAVFSDIHVSSGASTDLSNAGFSFPSGGCTSDVTMMTPQEKVLAFMFFDIASCVGPVVN